MTSSHTITHKISHFYISSNLKNGFSSATTICSINFQVYIFIPWTIFCAHICRISIGIFGYTYVCIYSVYIQYNSRTGLWTPCSRCSMRSTENFSSNFPDENIEIRWISPLAGVLFGAHCYPKNKCTILSANAESLFFPISISISIYASSPNGITPTLSPLFSHVRRILRFSSESRAIMERHYVWTEPIAITITAHRYCGVYKTLYLYACASAHACVCMYIVYMYI